MHQGYRSAGAGVLSIQELYPACFESKCFWTWWSCPV